MLIDAPQSSVSYFYTTAGLARVEDILRINGMSLADADGLKSLPGLLEGTAVSVVTRNQRLHGYNCPIVVRVEKAVTRARKSHINSRRTPTRSW